MMRIKLNALAYTSAVIVGLTLVGCNQPAGNQGTTGTTATDAHEADDHSGWWCVEHGIPEEECSMCSTKAAAAFKAKGDWCDEHNRAESQCFVCDPTRAEKFTKLYAAKFGHEPPSATE